MATMDEHGTIHLDDGSAAHSACQLDHQPCHPRWWALPPCTGSTLASSRAANLMWEARSMASCQACTVGGLPDAALYASCFLFAHQPRAPQDLSDIQWRTLRGSLPALASVFALHALVSSWVRKSMLCCTPPLAPYPAGCPSLPAPVATCHRSIWSSICRWLHREHVHAMSPTRLPPVYCHGVGCLVVFAVIAGNYLITHASPSSRASTTYALTITRRYSTKIHACKGTAACSTCPPGLLLCGHSTHSRLQWPRRGGHGLPTTCAWALVLPHTCCMRHQHQHPPTPQGMGPPSGIVGGAGALGRVDQPHPAALHKLWL